jgi:putative effector of murein hydrolase
VVVAQALPLYRNARRLQRRCMGIAAALIAGSLASITIGLSVAILAHAAASTVLAAALVVALVAMNPRPGTGREASQSTLAVALAVIKAGHRAAKTAL